MAQRTYDDEGQLCLRDSGDKMMEGCLAKGYFQDEDKGWGASARTQVYLSKTKLSLQMGI